MKNINKLLIVIVGIFFLMIIPLTSASLPTLGTFKQNSCITLLQTCVNCNYNNISSVTQPNGEQALGLVEMTKAGTEYTYSFCNTSKLGTYNVNGYGDPSGVKLGWNYIILVSPTGSESNTTFFIILGIITLAIVLMGFIFKNYIFAFFGGLSFLITGVYGMIYGYGNITNLYTQMISYILIGLGLIITVLSGLEVAGDSEGREEDDD